MVGQSLAMKGDIGKGLAVYFSHRPAEQHQPYQVNHSHCSLFTQLLNKL
ncbi:hypothetical protein GBAR_LOCUS27605 [Geodia barretti]|uniref:Uncharacterized protein n=1 Tax=Geodia barretti TaxID=519541 RepID=A0AA35TNF6_GEOBA|nr:hypothetical protein GBAR_LOCUS27605 [Geodia barretti]